MPVRPTPFSELSASEIALWNDVLEQGSQFSSPFLTYEFCNAADQASGNIVVATLGVGDNRAFLPFRRRKYTPMIADKVGGHMSDICGIIGGDASVREDEILSAAGLSVFCFDHWRQPGCPIVGDQITESQGIKVNVGSGESYFSSLRKQDRKFVNEVDRLERQLTEKWGELRFEWHSSNGQTELERLIAEKRKQYAQSGAADALSSHRSRMLLNILLATRSKNFEAVMSTIYCGRHWIASHFGLRYRDIMHIWFPVYNEEFRRFGPGHILLFKIFMHGSSVGIREFDFGVGVSPYKKKYGGTEYTVAKGSLRKTNMTALAHSVAQSIRWRVQRLSKASEN